MKYTRAQLAAAAGGSDDYHALMRSIAVSSLRSQAGFIAPVGQMFDDDKFNFTVVTSSIPLSAPMSLLYQIALQAEFKMCWDCARCFEAFINHTNKTPTGFWYLPVQLIHNLRFRETCDLCGGKGSF